MVFVIRDVNDFQVSRESVHRVKYSLHKENKTRVHEFCKIIWKEMCPDFFFMRGHLWSKRTKFARYNYVLILCTLAHSCVKIINFL